MKLSEMTIREKICQTVNLRLNNDILNSSLYEGNVKQFFSRYPVGSIFVGAEIIDNEKAQKQSLHEILAEANSVLPSSLLVAADLEAGAKGVGLVEFPSMMGLGATDDEKMAYRYGELIGQIGLSVGVNWTFAPVCDINFNLFNQITNIRSLSDSPERVARLCSEVVSGMQSSLFAACGKHFPGDGVDYRNQHIITSCNSLSKEEWMESYGMVYKALFEKGLHTVMAGHISLPAFQKEKKDGRYLGGTLSKDLLCDLLRDELGFEGLVVSDALSMGGFRKWYDTHNQASLECFKAGCDILLWPAIDYIDYAEKAVENGELSMERLDEAVQRILSLKQKIGLLDNTGSTVFDNEQLLKQGDEFALEVARKSLTLVRDEEGLLPLSKEKYQTAVIVRTIRDEKYNENVAGLANELTQKGIKTEVLDACWLENPEQWDKVRSADLIISAIALYPHRPMGMLDPVSVHGSNMWTILCDDTRKKTIALGLGSPYPVTEYYEACGTVINAYSACKATIAALSEALFKGADAFGGTSPVKIRP